MGKPCFCGSHLKARLTGLKVAGRCRWYWRRGPPFGLSPRLLLLQSPPQVIFVDSKNITTHHINTHKKNSHLFQLKQHSLRAFWDECPTGSWPRGLEKAHPREKVGVKPDCVLFSPRLFKPPPYGIQCLPDPSCSEEPPPTSSPVMSMHQSCVTSPYVQDWDWLIFFSQDFRAVGNWLNYLTSRRDCWFVCGRAISRSWSLNWMKITHFDILENSTTRSFWSLFMIILIWWF